MKALEALFEHYNMPVEVRTFAASLAAKLSAVREHPFSDDTPEWTLRQQKRWTGLLHEAPQTGKEDASA